jgi:hypothetical protein
VRESDSEKPKEEDCDGCSTSRGRAACSCSAVSAAVADFTLIQCSISVAVKHFECGSSVCHCKEREDARQAEERRMHNQALHDSHETEQQAVALLSGSKRRCTRSGGR